MRVGMALPKAVGYMVVLLLLYYSLQNQVYKVSLNVFFEGLMGTKASHTHAREKRVAFLSSSSYVLQAVINTSDLERVRTLLGEFILPFLINNTTLITSINTTTVCSSNLSGFQCRCEESYAWSYNSCINHEACDAIIGDTCGCVNALPADGQYCQLNTSRTETTPPPATTTPANDPVIIDLILDLRIPVSSVPFNFINMFRNTLKNVSLPYTITQSLQVTGLNFTTGCFPNSTGGLQCECEEQFAWPCDKCVIYGACSNVTRQTCGCINGLPSDGEYCRPITNVTQCPTPTTGTTTPMTTSTPMTITTTPPPTTTTTTTTQTTTPTMTTTTPPTTTPPTTTTQTTTPTMTMTTTTPTTTTPTPTTTTTTTTTQTMPTMTTTTTTQTTTAITPMTTATPNTTTVITQVRSLSFTMDMTFDSSYNNPNNIIYQDVYNSIERQSNTHISTFKAVESIRFRSGSTICDYAVRATSFQEMELKALEAGIFTELSEKYPIQFDSPTPLEFDPPQVLSGNRLTITCGPPPVNLNFGTNFTAEWRRDNVLILKDDQHEFSNGGTTLTVLRFFSTDNGRYQCKLRRGDKSAFRQTFNREFKLQERPLIQVSPVRQIVQCENGKEVRLTCSANSPYEVEFRGISTAGTGEITHLFPIDCAKTEEIITCQVKNFTDISRDITLDLSTENSFQCDDPVFGVGNEGDEALAPCEANEVGEKIVACEGDGEWREKRDNCVLEAVQKLLDQAEFLNNNSLPNFLSQLSNVTLNSTEDVVDSPATINAIVEILSTVANLSIPITRTSMEDILLTTGVLTTDEAQESWNFLNTNDTRNISVTARSVSSTFLLSLETITSSLTNDSFDIDTPFILLNKTTFTDTFNAEFNSSVETNILESDGGIKSITVITFASMDNVLPARDQDNSSFNVINGRVVLVQSNGTINNVSFTFDIINDTLKNPQCVFWNFSLFDGLGGWDSEGCELVGNINQTVTCNCNHLTSFSILMSPFVPNDPVLDFITYIGVGISMGSLVLCLIIEAVIWRKIRKNNTSYLRHVSIVNIAVSLLIANIWFIIGAAISDANKKNVAACNAATFFSHFFYLALFFWMLASALLLLYRTVSVFDGGLSKKSLLAIGFCLGYGAPLLIVIITIAVTAPKEEYIRQIGCWLNWDESRALLAFVIPALLIVVINFLILLVVMYKMLRRRVVGDSAQAAERHILVVIVRSLAVLTPFFGLTWGLGVGTVTDPSNRGIHVSFAFFNSLQGFFILVFGTLLDKKVRSEITIKSLTGTRTSSTGISSSGGLAFLRNWRRDGYNVSSSASGLSQSFTDI